MKTFIKNHYIAIIIYTAIVLIILNAQVCAGKYEGDPNAVCSESIAVELVKRYNNL